jgi:hypothetical protein
VAVACANLLTGTHESAAVAARIGLIVGLVLVTVVLPWFRERTPGQSLLGMTLMSDHPTGHGALRRALRAVVVWAPIAMLLGFGDATTQTSPSPLSIVLTGLALAWVCFLTMATAIGGGTGPADRWSGTTLRPRSLRAVESTNQ